MKAMLLHEPKPAEQRPLELAALPLPEPGPGEIRLAVRVCGVCRTDLHTVEGDLPLVELQVGLKVLPVGVAEAGAWRYAFLYELLPRWFPDVPEQARQIGRGEARRALVLRYLDNVVAADRKMIGKVFHVLKWTPAELDRTIAVLLQEGVVQEVQVEGLKHPQIISTRALEHNL